MMDIAAWDSQSASPGGDAEGRARGIFDDSNDFVVPEGFHLSLIGDEESFYPEETFAPPLEGNGVRDPIDGALVDDQILLPAFFHRAISGTA